MDITILQHAKDNQPAQMPLDEAAALIRGENRPEGYRPLAVFAAVLDGGRQKKHIRWLTGLAVAHVTAIGKDALAEARRKAADDLHTWLCFADEQGDGLYIVYPFELFDSYQREKQIQFHQRVAAWGSDYYARLLKAQTDRACCGVTHAIPLPVDPETFCSDAAQYFTSDEIRAKPPDQQKADATNQQATPREIEAFLKSRIFLRRNIVKGRPEYREPYVPGAEGQRQYEWQLFDNTMLNTLWADLRDERRVTRDEVYSVINSKRFPAFHPFHAYLDSLPPWDGQTDHIIGLAMTVIVEGSVEKQMLFVEYLRKWLVAMVAGWIDDQEVNSEMLIFIGRQGIYKTTWFRYLLPPELQQYYCTKVDSGQMQKDDRLKLSQYGLICCEELDTMSSSEMNNLKTVMTMTEIDERAPFDRFAEKRKHIASYCGTGNNLKFLNDKTGTRRFLPFEIKSIDNPRTHPVDYEGVFSQAYALYRQGFRYYFSKEEEQVLLEHNRRFETPRPEEELIDYYFRKPKDDETGEVMPTTIAMQVVCRGTWVRTTAEAMSRAFTNLDYEYCEMEEGAGFRVIQRTDDEIRQRAVSLAYQARFGIF